MKHAFIQLTTKYRKIPYFDIIFLSNQFCNMTFKTGHPIILKSFTSGKNPLFGKYTDSYSVCHQQIRMLSPMNTNMASVAGWS